jgi:chaperone required for assembly of F1-ATPase
MPQPGGPLQNPPRFYKDVSVEPRGGGIAILLDGRPAKTPGGRPLEVPTRRLAELLASEWRAQANAIDYAVMPATRLAHTSLDVVANNRAASVEGFTRFGSTDLICYFADHPKELVHRQERVWAPLLDWVKQEQGLAFVRASGIVHRPQPVETLAKLTRIAEAEDDFTLGGLAFAAALFGSAILALALRTGHVTADHAMAAARLDEIFQEETWGVDAEAEAKADAMAVEAVMLERWFVALRKA